MSTFIAKRKVVKAPENMPILVFLKPCNEKQDLNYIEKFVGTPEQILGRSMEIINGLRATFRNGDFSVKIENADFTQTLYVDLDTLFDSDFNVIGWVNDYLSVCK